MGGLRLGGGRHNAGEGGVTASVQCEHGGVHHGACRLDHHVAHGVDEADVDIAFQFYAVDDDAVDLVDAADHAHRVAQIVGLEGGNDGIPLHIRAEPAVHAVLVELPQRGDGDGEQHREQDTQPPVVLIVLIEQYRDVGAQDGEYHAAAEVQQLVPVGDEVVQLVDAPRHTAQQI